MNLLKKVKALSEKDLATISALFLTLGISCYYLIWLSREYYSPLGDFFAFKEFAEELFRLNFDRVFPSKRLYVYPFLMGLIAQIIPAKKALLYSGILISGLSYLGSIFLVHKISQQIGIKNSFLVSWFFAFSTLPLFCATQPLPEALILFLILLALSVKSDKQSLWISGLATLTRFDAAVAVLANIPKILVKKKRRLVFLIILIFFVSAAFLGFYYLKAGKTGYIGSIIGPEAFTIKKPMGNFILNLRSINLFYLPDDHPATVSPEARFHTRWWVQLIWIMTITVMLIGAFHLVRSGRSNHWKIHIFFGLYLLFLWFYHLTDWRKMYFIVWLFPLYTIAGIEYLLHQSRRRKRIILVSLTLILGILAAYYADNTPFINNLYHDYFSLSSNLPSFKSLLPFLPICTYVFLKLRKSRSKSSLILLPAFLLLTPIVSSHISAVDNMHRSLWDLKAGMEVMKKTIKRDEKVFMSVRMERCATYFSGIPEKNIVTFHSQNISPRDIKYIASYRSWDDDPVLQQLENNPDAVVIGDQKIRVAEIGHVAMFRLFRLGTITVHGQVRVDTEQSRFGRASTLFDGAGSRLQLVHSPDWAFGSDDFTIDFWVRFAETSETQVLIGYPYYAPHKSWQIAWDEEFKSLKFCYSTDGSNNIDIRFPWSPSEEIWYHIAVVRKGSGFKAFVDGIELGRTHDLGHASFHASSDPVYIGSRGNEEHFSGWMDEIRLSRGTARWTKAFPPPSHEYSSDSYTVLLLHCNGEL